MIELEAWLLNTPHVDDGGAAFGEALVHALVAAGLPISRLSYALMTKHPEVLWRTVQWREGEGVVTRDQPHARLNDAFYTASAVATVRATKQRVHVPLRPGPLAYPLAEELRAAGATDYVVLPLAFTTGAISYASFTTRADGGFSEAHLASLDAIAPRLAARIEIESAYYGTRALLEVYLGRNAARRVSAGAFQRGQGELIDAAIWFSDMRDFTAMSDRSSPSEVVQTLDALFDTLSGPISAQGGEVLKFIGDAVLAIFPLEADPKGACRRALSAAREALLALDQSNAARVHPVQVGIGLHRGQVMYGNIGARDRLDFTVISSAVNEASRLEGLCKKLGTSLAMSEAFATTADVEGVIDLGEHELKGVVAPLRVFGFR